MKDHRILVLAATAVLLTACSGSAHGRQARFIACMRHHGVTLPDPGPSGQIAMPTGPPTRLQAALQSCQRFQTTHKSRG